MNACKVASGIKTGANWELCPSDARGGGHHTHTYTMYSLFLWGVLVSTVLITQLMSETSVEKLSS